MTTIEEQGFQISDDVLDSGECDELISQLYDNAVLRSRAGARHLLSVPAIAMLASDPRMLTIASSALCKQAIPFRVTLFDKSPRANWSVVWHQDTALPLRSKFDKEGWGPWSVKAGVRYAHAPTTALNRIVALRVHLDDSMATNGPLRVVPGSHRLGVLSDEQVHDIAGSSRSVVCLVRRGGILSMRPLLIHSSSRIIEPGLRRVLHIEYAEDLHVAPGVELAAA